MQALVLGFCSSGYDFAIPSSRLHLAMQTLGVALRFVGNYALCGLSPQTDGMPVIHKNSVLYQDGVIVSSIFLFRFTTCYNIPSYVLPITGKARQNLLGIRTCFCILQLHPRPGDSFAGGLLAFRPCNSGVIFNKRLPSASGSHHPRFAPAFLT